MVSTKQRMRCNATVSRDTCPCIERDALVPMEKLNVSGGPISIGHPYGMTGSRLAVHILRELRRRKKRFGIVTMCVGAGRGAAGLFEAFNA